MENTSSRTVNTTKNLVSAVLMQLIKLLLKFVNRTVLISVLGMAYVGLDSVFSNVLTLLSLSELGIGTAIIFDMYKPIAYDDKPKIKSLVRFYRTVYGVIGIAIFVLGLIALPFLDKIAKLPEGVELNIYIVYLLFLINTSSGYFFAHKKSLLNGYQQAYVDNNMQTFFTIGLNIFQIVFLVIFKNYYLFVALMILSTVLENIMVARYVNKHFPYINEKSEKLKKEDRKGIFKNVGYLSVEKFAGTFLTGCDSIILSVFCGLIVAGKYSNYYLIIAGVATFLGYFLTSFTSSVGNLISSESSDAIYAVFNKLRFAFVRVNGFCTICLATLLPRFIDIWVGRENAFSMPVVVLIVLYQYFANNRSFIRVFKTAGGLFKNYYWLYIVETLLKIGLAIAFVNSWGEIGLLIASITSFICTGFIMEPVVVYKNIFKYNSLEYYKHYLIEFLILAIGYVIIYEIISFVSFDGILGFILCLIICVVFVSAYYLMFSVKSEYFRFYINMLKGLIKGRNV